MRDSCCVRGNDKNKPDQGNGSLDSCAAGAAVLRYRNGRRAAVRTEPGAAGGSVLEVRRMVRGASPDQCGHPAYERPSEEEVEQEDADGVALVPTNDGGQKVQQHHENEAEHGATPEHFLPVDTRNGLSMFQTAQGVL